MGAIFGTSYGMRSFSDKIYNSAQDAFAAAQPEFVLDEEEVPNTVSAEIDDSLPTINPVDISRPVVIGSQAWKAVSWQPRLGDITEYSSDSDTEAGPRDPLSKEQSGEVPPPPPRPRQSSRWKEELERKRSDSIHSLETIQQFQSRLAHTVSVGSRRSSIVGTTLWTPNAIHYRIRTRTGQGSISGASAFSQIVEVDSTPGVNKIQVPRPFSAITTFHDQPITPLSAVHELATHDDGDRISPWRTKLHAVTPLATSLSLGAYFAYFAYRVYATLEAQRTLHRVFPVAWLFIASEFLVSIPTCFNSAYTLISAGGRRRPKLRLEGNQVPCVDVFITCCNEDVDVVADTVRAACVQDYPSSRYRVIVCDDGADLQLRTVIEGLSLEHLNLYYHARIKIKGKPHHFKAGNLIAATEMVELLPGGAGEYIAALDADMIPEPDWLRCVVAHMVKDPQMGLVCPPQLFYNVPDNDPLVQSLDAFVHVMEPTKDANGVAWCTGSGYVIRRKALEAIGGWPTGSLAEDVYTSSLLLGNGWKTAFVHEPLQFGTIPDTYTSHLKQRTRWSLGTIQTAIKLNFCIYGDVVKNMTFFQRLSGFLFPAGELFSLFLTVVLVSIPVVLVSGGTLVAYANYNDLRWQIRLAFIALILTRFHEFVGYLPASYRFAQRDALAHVWMTPYHSLTVIRSVLLPSWLGIKPMAFKPTGSIKGELGERDAQNRAPLWRRCVVIIWTCVCYIHLAYVLFVLVAVALSTSRAFTSGLQDTTAKLMYLLTHAFWPPMLWIICLTAFATPLFYMVFPPTVPDREDLLDRDPKTGVARPKPYWKKRRWGKWTFWHETQWTVCTLYSAVLFVGTFIY